MKAQSFLSTMTFTEMHLGEAIDILRKLDYSMIEDMATELATRRNKGRVFFLGVGGSAANCSHAVNDFRKICGLECYAPTDNVSELTARTNDEGWETIFSDWLRVSRLSKEDVIFVMSVGGGNKDMNVSPNLVTALQLGKETGCKIMGFVGRDGGYTKKVGDLVCVIPTVNKDSITPHTEAFQAILWHCLVSNPVLKKVQTKWESTKA